MRRLKTLEDISDMRRHEISDQVLWKDFQMQIDLDHSNLDGCPN